MKHDKERPAPGHARPAHPPHAGVRRHARLGHLPAPAAVVTGRPAGQSGVALPGALPARAARVDRVGVGRFREQPAGQVLPADASPAASSWRRKRRAGSASPPPSPACCSTRKHERSDVVMSRIRLPPAPRLGPLVRVRETRWTRSCAITSSSKPKRWSRAGWARPRRATRRAAASAASRR